MEFNLFQGREDIVAVYFSDDSFYSVGVGDVSNIRVSMECGQMAGVPWFEIWRFGKIDQLINAAMVSTVSFA
jgi:hypothetical protein